MNIQAALVRAVLEKWRAYEWSVQGFGFLRTKIADVGRPGSNPPPPPKGAKPAPPPNPPAAKR